MANTEHIDRLLDLEALSEYSSLAVSTLRNYIRSGGLPHYKLPGKILVKLSEFYNWLESFRVDSEKDLNSKVNEVIESLNKN